jgi:hypothetical protein
MMALQMINPALLSFHGLLAPTARCEGRMDGLKMENSLDGLKTLASELNPVVGYWDPLKLGEQEFWGESNEFTIGWFREAEVKHGRVAMAGFVGYIVHANGIRWPWGTVPGDFPKDLSPEELWDAIPFAAKAQIILVVGVFEFWRENVPYALAPEGEKHYTAGGKIGYFPSFDAIPHPCPLPLFDPLNFSKGRSEKAKADGLLKEINNGRLAMIGLFGFLAEGKVPGSVPVLSQMGVIKQYSGQVMAPFTCIGADCAAGGIPPAEWGF